MRICMIGKYPPIEGGVSSQMYWLARCAAELGHDVHVVTNANEVEPAYRMYLPRGEETELECRFANGGRVRVHQTEEPSFHSHIPYSNPFVSKLAAIATDVIEQHDIEFIFSSYMEPYGFAAALASQWTGIPYGVKHAGSDLGRLAQMPARTSSFVHLLRNAHLVFTGRALVRSLVRAKVEYHKLHLGLPAYWPRSFSPDTEPLDIAALLAEVREGPFADAAAGRRPYDPTLPTIGIYGKVGRVKGTPELVEALASLKRRGARFNLVALSGVAGTQVSRFREHVQHHDLTDCTYLLPFLPHWLVPRFLRACTAVCVLENRFPVAIHQPGTPHEVLACGRALVLSDEILAKQVEPERFVDRDNFFRVRDPKDRTALATVLSAIVDDPAGAERVGERGRALFTHAGDVGRADIYLPLFERITESLPRSPAMSLAELQRFMTSLYTDARFRTDARRAPDRLDGFALDAGERSTARALLAMQREVDEFADELHSKTYGFLVKHFRTVARLFDATTDPRLMVLFKEQYDFRDRGWLGNIAFFADILRTYAAALEPAIAARFDDAVRYDELLLRTSTIPLPSIRIEDLDAATRPLPPAPRAAIAPDWVAAVEEVAIGAFAHDIPRLLRDGGSGGACTLAFVPTRDAPTAKVFYLSPTMEQLVRGSTRAPTATSTLVARAATQRGIAEDHPAFRTAASQAICALIEHGILQESTPP